MSMKLENFLDLQTYKQNKSQKREDLFYAAVFQTNKDETRLDYKFIAKLQASDCVIEILEMCVIY